jgi:alkaline phosphatase
MRCYQRGVAAVSRRLVLMAAVFAALLCTCEPAWAAKNVILMIADGSGHNAWLAASMYQGKVGKQVYDQPGWLRFACCTYPLNRSGKPTGDQKQDSSLVYDPLKAWDCAPESGKGGGFAGYAYLKSGYTDSAAAATALASGRKVYDGSINWSNDDRPLRGLSIAEIAKARGKSAGVITTVPWSHATPAGLGGAHNQSRDNYAEIANEMLGAAWLDVIMGAGNPDYDDDGRPIATDKKHGYQYVGGQESWQALKSGTQAWKLIESKADFEALATGPTPAKVLGTAQVATTLQANRGLGRATLSDRKATEPEPFAVPLNRNVPSLAVMTRAAINCLDDNPNGFYLMIEGGAVDWANHKNEPDRMVEEQIDFVKAVEAVVAWVESNSNWDDTLLILSADHETGLLWGPDSPTVAFQPLVDCGSGKLPGMKHNSSGHSNSLVPLYARGPGSQRFAALVKGTDPKAAAAWRYSGQYVENTDVFKVMCAEVTATKDQGQATRPPLHGGGSGRSAADSVSSGL